MLKIWLNLNLNLSRNRAKAANRRSTQFLHPAVQIYEIHTQLFRERLSEKVHATIPKGIVGGFKFTVNNCSKKFERMARETKDGMFASAKEKQQK